MRQIMIRLHCLVLAFGLSLGLPSGLHAATTSNLTYPDPGWPGDTVTRTAYLASSFTTNASAASYTLDTVIVDMGTAITPGGGFKLELRSDQSLVPGAVVAELVGEGNPSDGLFAYTPAATVILNANTTYWLVASVSGGTGEYRWRAAASNDQTGDWAIGNNIGFSGNSGANWSLQGFPPSLFSISATAVPEPGSAILLLLGGAGMCLHRRSRGCRRA